MLKLFKKDQGITPEEEWLSTLKSKVILIAQHLKTKIFISVFSLLLQIIKRMVLN
jgi:hypothetical protein